MTSAQRVAARALTGLMGAALFGVVCAASPAFAQAPLIQQVVVDPDGVGFVEVLNPTDEPIALQEYHLATVADYFRVVDGGVSLGAQDFLVRFPDGAELLPGSAVVQWTGTGEDFEVAHGFVPEFALSAADDASTEAMVAVEAIPDGAGPASAGGTLVLFRWDGVSDLVEDADIVIWGSGAFVDKSGVGVDGPDDDADESVYADDTDAMTQRPAQAPGEGEALLRVDAQERDETLMGGNGVDGHDETSEDMAAAFEVASPAPVAQIPVFGEVAAQSGELEGVELTFDDGADFQATVETGVGGEFALELPAAATLSVRASRNGELLRESTLVTDAGTMRGVVISLDPLTISGQVQAAAGATLTLSSLSVAITETGQTAALDDTGAFEFEVSTSGSYTLVVSGPGVAENSTSVDVDGASVADVVIEVSAVFSVGGVVTASETGEPLAGVLVSASSSTTRTDSAGVYLLEGLSPGEVTLTFSLEGYVEDSVVLQVQGAEALDVALNAAPRFSLVVSVMAEGEPLAEALVTPVAGPLAGATATARTGANGSAVLVDLPGGFYTLEVAREGFRTVTIRTVNVDRDTSLTVMLIPSSRQPEVTRTRSSSCSTAPFSGRSPVGPALWWALGVLGLWSVRRRFTTGVKLS